LPHGCDARSPSCRRSPAPRASSNSGGGRQLTAHLLPAEPSRPERPSRFRIGPRPCARDALRRCPRPPPRRRRRALIVDDGGGDDDDDDDATAPFPSPGDRRRFVHRRPIDPRRSKDAPRPLDSEGGAGRRRASSPPSTTVSDCESKPSHSLLYCLRTVRSSVPGRVVSFLYI
jgi:hypothetical protein